MLRNLLPRLRNAVMVGLALLGAAPAFGQAQPAVLQPETAVVSPGGVDANSGQYRFEGEDLSIGSEGNGGITLRRVEQGNKPFTTNWHIFLNRDCDNPPKKMGQPSCTYTWKLESMAVTKTWLEGTPGQWKEQGLPSAGYTKLDHAWTSWRFTMSDGTIIVFESGSNGDVWAQSMTRKDGVVYTFAYDSGGDPDDGDKRLRRVTSNTGYELMFEYVGNGNDNITKACVFNTSVVTPPSGNITCPTGTGVQTASYVHVVDGKPLTSITDAVGKVWTIDRQATTRSYYKPGIATPWLVNTVGTAPDGGFREPFQVVLNQQLADGRTIDYDYTNLLIYEPDPPQPGSMNSGRGTGWTVNNSQSTQLGWTFAQQAMGGQAGPLYISPAPTTMVDPLGRLSGVTFAGTGTTPYGEVLSKLLPGGRRESYTYSTTPTGGMNLASRTAEPRPGSGGTNLVTSYTYDCTVTFNCAKPKSITDPNAQGSGDLTRNTDYTYSPTTGLLETETMPDPDGIAGPQPRPQKRYTWVPSIARYKDSSGAFVNGAAVLVINSISECRTLGSCAGTADETLTTFAYPAFGVANNILPISKTVQSGNGTLIATTTFTYDAAGNKLTEDGPLSGTSDTSRWQYDAKRRVTHTMTPDPDGATTTGVPLAVRNTYDDAGRLTKVENAKLPNQATTWGVFTVIDSVETDYDILDRKVQERKKDANNVIEALTQYSYDSFGRLDCTAVRMNKAAYGSLPASACTLGTQGTNGPDRITRNSYDAGNQLLTVTEAVGTTDQAIEASYDYTTSGKKEFLTDARGYKAQMVYDGHDRQTEWRFPDKTSLGVVSSGATVDYEQYAYDNNSNRTSLRKRDGSVLTFAYDNLNRMVTKTVPGSTPSTRDVFMRYDLQGHQLDARFDSLSGEGLASSYDALGRLTLTTLTMDSTARTLTYGYDIRGFRTSLAHADNKIFEYTPDTLGRLTTLKENTSTPTTLRGYSYDTNGRLISSALSTFTPGSTTYSYDTIGRLTGLTHNIFGTAADVNWTFTHSPASQTLSQVRDNDSYAWTGAVAATRNYTTNGLNQYTQVVSSGTIPFTYDANGNLSSSSDASGSWAYLYDVENRLVKSTFTPTTGPAAVTDLRYDPMGRLYEVAGASTTRFLYDGDELVGEYSTAGALLKRYVHGIAVDDPVIQYEGSGIASTALRHLIADRQGSVIGVADKDGNIVAKNTYDEYGIPKSDQGTLPVAGRFAYTGQIWIPELGMYHYKARLYSPTLGRFMQTDPIGYDDQINLYAYVGNDPMNASDPTGMCLSIGDATMRAACETAREAAVGRAKEYVNSQPRAGRGDEEVAYSEFFDVITGEVTTQSGDDAGRRTGNDVTFSDLNGNDIRAKDGGRVLEMDTDGNLKETNSVWLVSGHDHPPEATSPRDGAGRATDASNENVRRNPIDQRLSRKAPAVIRSPSGKVREFRDGDEVKPKRNPE